MCTLLALVNAVAFLLVRPAVGDLWAARARQSATANGVGLGYWFSWYSGGSTPGNYSVLMPYLSAVLGAVATGAAATFAITPLCGVLVRGAAHARAATVVATVVTGLSLWSGRVPFAVGSAVSLVAFIAVRRRRPVLAGAATALTALFSPVSATFVVLGACALTLSRPGYRLIGIVAATCGVAALGTIALVFGVPGPQPFSTPSAVLLTVEVGLMLLARPMPYVRTVILIALAVVPLLVFIPNGMGSNFQRLVWICLPIAVVATAQTRARVAVLTCVMAMTLGAQATIHDLDVAMQARSSQPFYASLVAELDRLRGFGNYRVEVVPDGTHTSAYALLQHAMLARGYETQAEDAYDGVLTSSKLNPVSFKIWLDNNAVGLVAEQRVTHEANAEDTLIRHHRPAYLTQVWADSRWVLYRVANPSPIVAAPAGVVDADQATLTIEVPRAGRYELRVHWSRFLALSPPRARTGRVTPDGQSFTILDATTPGRYTLHG